MASSPEFKRWASTVEENNRRQISALIDLSAWSKHEVIDLGQLEAYKHVPGLKGDYFLNHQGENGIKISRIGALFENISAPLTTADIIPGTTHLEINIRVKKQELIADINQKVCPRNPMKAILWKMGFTKKLIAASKEELHTRINEYQFKSNIANGKCAILSETKDRMIVYELGDIMLENKHQRMIFIPYAKPFGIWVDSTVTAETMAGVAKHYMPYTKIV